jgi:chromosome segregation ATPase
MTLIRRQLYEDLINTRAEILDKLEQVTADLAENTSALAELESSKADFDKTQAAIRVAIDGLKARMKELDQNMKDLDTEAQQLEEDMAAADEDASFANDDVARQKKILGEMQDEGESAERIAEQQQVVDAAEASLASAEARLVAVEDKRYANKEAMERTDSAMADTDRSISEYNKQLADNEEQNSNIDEQIAEVTNNISDVTEKKNRVQADYDSFNAENKDTIKAYEAQEIARDENIVKENPNQVFYREPANGGVLAESNEVMRDEVLVELNPTEEEAGRLKNYIEAGQDNSINPDFLRATEAADLTLGSIWSTKTIAKQIKDACRLGMFETKCEALPNSVIYALQQAGYTVYLSEATGDSKAHVVVSWENLGSKNV